MALTHLVKLSAGRASAVTDALVVDEYGRDVVERLFTDTLIEDNDAYRFLIEWCGRMEGVDVADLLPLALALPQVWEDEAARKVALATLRMRATSRLRRLHWIADGRHPFDVFFSERMMGSSRMDPCSKHLKRDLSDRWLRERFTPDSVLVYVGLGHHERHRYEGRWITKKGQQVWKRGIAELMRPWTFLSPLIERPEITKDAMLGYIRSFGIAPPRLYALGYPANNCGGACVKAGHMWWLHLLRTNRPYYLWWERLEARFILWIGNPRASILRDRRGGVTRPLTLANFRQMHESGDDLTELLIYSDYGCGGGCALGV